MLEQDVTLERIREATLLDHHRPWEEDSSEASDEEDEQKELPPVDAMALLKSHVQPVNRFLESGAWQGRIRWNDDEMDEEDVRDPATYMLSRLEIAPSPEDKEQEQKRFERAAAAERERRRKIPKVDHSLPAKLHRFFVADPPPTIQFLFHRPRLAKQFLAPGITWRLQGPKKKTDEPKDITASCLRASDGPVLCLEYAEEAPPVVANAGMASSIVRLRRPNDDDASYRPTESSSEEFCDVELGDEEHLLLGADEDGDLAWCSGDLFRAPIFFQTKNTSSLFLLVLEPRERTQQQDSFDFTIRPCPKFAVCGQIEPRVVVPTIQSHVHMYGKIQEPIVAFAVARTFGAVEVHKNESIQAMVVGWEEIKDALFKHIEVKQNIVKRALKVAGASVKGDKGADLWGPRRKVMQLPQYERYSPPPLNKPPAKSRTPSPVDMKDEDKKKDAIVNYADCDELATRFSPEDVCVYEAANAFQTRLKRLGLRSDEKSSIARKAATVACQILLRKSKAAQKRVDYLRSRLRGTVANAHSSKAADDGGEKTTSFGDLVAAAEKRSKQLDRVLTVARLIHEELTFSPVEITKSFVDFHVLDNPKAAIRVSGLGDPSGRGEALSFVRGTFSDAMKTKGRPRNDAMTRAGRSAKLKAAYLERIRAVVERQRASLSEDHHGQDYEMDDDDHDDGLDGSLPRRRQPKVDEPMPSTQEGKEEPQQPQQQPQQQDEKEDSDQELSDLEKDLEDELLAQDDDDDDGRGRKSKGPSAASEARELERLRKEMAEARQQQQQTAPEEADHQRPVYAVRRLRRVVDDQGREKLVVSFDVRRTEVDRVARLTGFHTETAADVPPDDELLDGLDFLDDDGAFDMNLLGGIEDTVDETKPVVPQQQQQPRRYKPAARGRGHAAQRGPPPKIKIPAGTAPPVKPSKKPRGSTKINFSKLKRNHEEHQALQKRQKLEKQKTEGAAIYFSHQRGRGRSGHLPKRQRTTANRQQQPHVRLAKLFDDAIILPAMRRPNAGLFMNPVPKDTFPTYREKVKNPMDLSTIRDRLTRRYVYRTREPLLADLQLIADNSATFNGPDNPITLEARAMFEEAKHTMATTLKDQLDLLEKETHDATTWRRKTSHKPAARKPKSQQQQQRPRGVSPIVPSVGTPSPSHLGTDASNTPLSMPATTPVHDGLEDEEVLEEEVVLDDDDEDDDDDGGGAIGATGQEDDEEEVLEEGGLIDDILVDDDDDDDDGPEDG